MNKSISGKLPLVRHMGISIWDPVWATREHQGSGHELVHIIKGTVTLHIGGKAYRAEAGDILVVPAGVPHRDVFPIESVFEALLVHFVWPDLETVLPSRCNGDLTKLPEADKARAREMAHDLYRTFREGRSLGRELTDTGLYRLLLFLISAVQDMKSTVGKKEASQQQDRQRQIIDRAKEYINDHLDKPVTLTDIADHLKMSSYHLSHLFSRESGFTFSEYLTHKRMDKAVRLLGNPAIRVADAAFACGFEDPNYFGKVFRKHFGVSPGAFRSGRARKKGK